MTWPKCITGDISIEDDPTAGVRDGYEFDSSGEFEPFSFTVGAGSVISGWDEAMTYMKDGSEAKLIIPSRLAYSSQQTVYYSGLFNTGLLY